MRTWTRRVTLWWKKGIVQVSVTVRCGPQEEYYGMELILADRDLVEQGADEILKDADVTDVAFLVVGDPFGWVMLSTGQNWSSSSYWSHRSEVSSVSTCDHRTSVRAARPSVLQISTQNHRIPAELNNRAQNFSAVWTLMTCLFLWTLVSSVYMSRARFVRALNMDTLLFHTVCDVSSWAVLWGPIHTVPAAPLHPLPLHSFRLLQTR